MTNDGRPALDTRAGSMAVSDWLEIYRAYSGPDLDAEMVSLQAGLKGGFVSQGSGSVQHQRDLTELRDRLRAATRVKSERAGQAGGRIARVDFSGTRTSDF
jgi:hypothetical protein